MADLRQVFGSQVRQHRRRKNWTQTGLSRQVGLSLDMIGRLERGQAAPSLETIEKLSAVFGVPAAILLGGAPFAENAASERERIMQRLFRLLSDADDKDLERVEQVLSAMLRR